MYDQTIYDFIMIFTMTLPELVLSQLVPNPREENFKGYRWSGFHNFKGTVSVKFEISKCILRYLNIYIHIKVDLPSLFPRKSFFRN